MPQSFCRKSMCLLASIKCHSIGERLTEMSNTGMSNIARERQQYCIFYWNKLQCR